MEHKIDTSKSNIRTDLAIESINNTSSVLKKEIDNITIEKVNITKKESRQVNKKEGVYITISFDDITNFEDREKIGKVLTREIKDMLKMLNIKDSDKCLIIGLGNKLSTPDALGPLCINNIVITSHLYYLGYDVKEGIRNVAAISPGVTSQTGIETSDYVMAITNLIKPDFVIVIDSLASLSIDRVNKTIQMTNTGIHPGSGVGNNRKEISSSTLNVPVIAIGVPTVISSSVIVNDTIEYLYKHISYLKNNYDKSKLMFNYSKDYAKKIRNEKLNDKEKEKVLGLIGSLSDIDKNNLINEVLSSTNYNLIVTPKEIDFLIDKIANIISSSINNALNRQITHY